MSETKDCEVRADGYVYCLLCDDWWPPSSAHATRAPLPLSEQIKVRIERANGVEIRG